MEKEKIKENLKELRKKNKGFLDEFKEFVMRGNVLDLAVGVIIGGAFSSLVTSLVNNILSPIIGCFAIGGFNGWTIKILNADLAIGSFIMDVINFIIMAFVIFIIIKFVNKIASLGDKKDSDDVEDAPIKSDETVLLEEILDELKKANKK